MSKSAISTDKPFVLIDMTLANILVDWREQTPYATPEEWISPALE